MHHYHNLLYVSHGHMTETEGLRQALALASHNTAPLTVLVVAAEFPEEFVGYQEKYQEALRHQAQEAIDTTRQALDLAGDALDISITVINEQAPTIQIIQYVLQHGHDLVLKEAESRDAKGGFKSIDMALLRKCPVPVWLARPITHARQQMKVAVAIDPESRDEAAEALSRRMLALSRSVADSCGAELHIVSCWDYVFEEYLRQSVWAKVSDANLMQTVLQAQQKHRQALDGLIKVAGVAGVQHIHHVRGEASALIPGFVRDHAIDILVMGTVARSGIPGFMIGNTAEDIVQQLTCSLLALKPQGFISPVTVSS